MPLQVPQAYVDAFSSIADERRRLAHAMGALLDDEVRRVVLALRETADVHAPNGTMWERTLLTFHSDNGGEILFAGVCGGNNWPLTGGKFSNWEGGIRVPALLAGGALPAHATGTTSQSLVTAWDWYATYAALAAVDPTDEAAAAAGLPPIDSINVWGALVRVHDPDGLMSASKRARTDAALVGRTEVVLGETSALWYNGDGDTLVGGLIDADGYKILLGPANKGYRISQYVQTGPSWPNGAPGVCDASSPSLRHARGTRALRRRVRAPVRRRGAAPVRLRSHARPCLTTPPRPPRAAQCPLGWSPTSTQRFAHAMSRRAASSTCFATQASGTISHCPSPPDSSPCSRA